MAGRAEKLHHGCASPGRRERISKVRDIYVPEPRPTDAGRGLLQCAVINPDGSLTEAGIHLAKARKLIKQTEPPL